MSEDLWSNNDFSRRPFLPVPLPPYFPLVLLGMEGDERCTLGILDNIAISVGEGLLTESAKSQVSSSWWLICHLIAWK